MKEIIEQEMNYFPSFLNSSILLKILLYYPYFSLFLIQTM